MANLTAWLVGQRNELRALDSALCDSLSYEIRTIAFLAHYYFALY